MILRFPQMNTGYKINTEVKEDENMAGYMLSSKL